ncbi:MAG: hypothetical protein E6560_10695 [Yersiniaceae bacterium]|nr:hypothetical protein [Yersiniaceae bacterium]
MSLTKNTALLMISGLMSFMVFAASTDNQSTYIDRKPDFKEYATSISQGPFSTQLILDDEQNSYSAYWKNNMLKELSKPANFAGHYRLYLQDRGKGKECQHGVCGWILDKLSGAVISGLPEYDGSNSYGSVGDNGTPVGKPLEILIYKNSKLMILTGQAIPFKIENDEYGLPITYPCKAIYYVFENNQFRKIAEDENGCGVE